MNRFCVNCGVDTESLVGGLCSKCYLEKHEVLEIPSSIKIDYDKRSDKLRVGRNWLPNEDATLASVASDKILALAKPKRMPITGLSVSIERLRNFASAMVSFSTEINGIPIRVEKEIKFFFHGTISDASMKIASYYHEAIIQIRFSSKPTLEEGRVRLKELLAMLAEQKKKIELSHPIDTINVKGGFDVLVGSSKAAKIVSKRLAEKHGLRVIYSNKMIGINDNSTTKYRHTYCLKFPPVEKK